MLNLPTEVTALLALFAPLFTPTVWSHAQLLVVGAILTPGKRTVTAILSIMGLRQSPHFQNYHRVLNRARWSSRAMSQTLLRMVLEVFAPQGPIVLGLDDTLERRRGEKITAKGIYRDPVRSSHSHFVKASGLRWLSLMLLVRVPWAGAVWALPFLTVLAPSERYHQERRRRHKKLTDWARQMLGQVRRWVPQRELVVVADSSFAVLTLLHDLRHLPQPVSMLTRLRLDAALYEPAPARACGQPGRPRSKGKRLPTLLQVLHDSTTSWAPLTVCGWYRKPQREVEIVSATAVWYHSGLPPVPIRWVLIRDPVGKFAPQALLSTEVTLTPLQMVTWFVQRWQIEVTFQEVRTHLGVETQRQWADLAIARTTPALFGLFTVVTLLAHRLSAQHEVPTRAAAWYLKEIPTFADALALVRSHLWQHAHFSLSQKNYDLVQIPRPLFDCLTETLCYAA
ncbi:MAG: transposase [Rhodobacteraceae bacterium]|nr:transposase [Paracoccaceae bacterium]